MNCAAPICSPTEIKLRKLIHIIVYFYQLCYLAVGKTVFYFVGGRWKPHIFLKSMSSSWKCSTCYSTIYKLQCLSLRNGFPFQFHIFSRVQNFFGLLSVLQNVAKWKIVTKRKKKYTAFILKMGYRTNQIKSMWHPIFPFHEKEAALYQPLAFLQLKNNKWIIQSISGYEHCILKFSVLLDFFFQLNLFFLFIHYFQW